MQLEPDLTLVSEELLASVIVAPYYAATTKYDQVRPRSLSII